MPRSAYYGQMRVLAQEKRKEHGVETSSLNVQVMRRIYGAEGVKIDYWPFKGNRVRAAYFCDDGEPSVAIKKGLPREPKLFALAHELKHHLVDQEKIRNGEILCGDYNANQLIEIGAEVFAAEFIFPEEEMRSLVEGHGITAANCSPERLVEFKRSCPALVSFQFLVKRFERFQLCDRGAYAGVQFQKLEEQIHGLPIYKQPWFQRRRAMKKRVRWSPHRRS